MKSILKLTLVLLILSFVLISCSEKNITAPGSLKDGATTSDIDHPRTVSYPIWAGQTINAGTMTIWNDASYFYVKYETTGGWVLNETQVHIDDDLVGDWIHDNGTPVPGQFDYSATHNPPVTMYLYSIPRSYYTYGVGDTILIAAHCVVSNPDYQGGTEQETGWGGDIPGPGPRWWFYMWYTITDGPNPPVTYQEETAMMRMYDVATDFTYRWMKNNQKPHSWFSYVKTTPTLAPQTYYFYAGRYYKCGEVQIWKDGTDLKVQIGMIDGWYMSQSHLNVQLTGFVGSPSFGLFPYTAPYDPITQNYTYTIPWNSAWDGMELNIALHADVQRAEMPK